MESGYMSLMDRKLKILQAIIDDFINTAQPVGSRTLAKKYNLGISSATIRNEMSDLEEMGYLLQPHTSAGRIPSDQGYRLYVDSLMKQYRIETEQKKIIKALLVDKIVEIDDLIHQSSKVLSQLTKLTSISLSPQFNKSKLKNIKLVKVDEDKVLLVLVADSGMVKNVLLRINDISQNTLDQITSLFQIKLCGCTIDEINDEIVKHLKNEIIEYSSTIDKLIPILQNTLKEIDNREIYLEGITNIFNLPEYSDVNKVKEFLATIEKKELILDILDSYTDNGICIKIGSENKIEEMKDCSLITATYTLDGKIIGKIGVIGPTRIDYCKVVPVIEYITKTLNDIIKDMSQ